MDIDLELKRAKKREVQNRYNRKKRLPKEITTEFLERELIKKYHDPSADDDEKKSYLKYMIKIWETKHKVPNAESSDEEIDLGVNPNGASEPVFTE